MHWYFIEYKLNTRSSATLCTHHWWQNRCINSFSIKEVWIHQCFHLKSFQNTATLPNQRASWKFLPMYRSMDDEIHQYFADVSQSYSANHYKAINECIQQLITSVIHIQWRRALDGGYTVDIRYVIIHLCSYNGGDNLPKSSKFFYYTLLKHGLMFRICSRSFNIGQPLEMTSRG